ncbi:MAG: type II secretion system F family protein [Candidatus Eremiobacteraeota bacterium]|nr:type II secretion system F family protein [Candidatus Eremiobacteraeota bacterium]
MKVFSYTIKNQDGRTLSGTLSATTKQAAIDSLKEKFFVITKIKERTLGKGIFPFLSRGVKLSELMNFTSQLAIAIEAGMSLTKSLSMISRDMPDCTMKLVLHQIANEIEKGSTLTDAINEHPEVFPRYYRSLIRAGEISGELDSVLNGLASYIEDEAQTRGTVMKALYYPLMVITFSMIIVIAIITIVVPKFKGFYDTFGGDLPAPTQLFMDISEFVGKYFIFIGIAIILALTGISKFVKSKRGQYIIDKTKLRIFFLKDLFLKASIGRFAKSLSVMYKTGVPIVEALEIVAETTENVIIEDILKKAAKRVKDGERLVTPLRMSGLFTNMAISMINTGEETGRLQFMLEKLSKMYERDVDNKVKGLTSLIEPILMVFMGIIIGITLIVLMLPMMNLSNIIAK